MPVCGKAMGEEVVGGEFDGEMRLEYGIGLEGIENRRARNTGGHRAGDLKGDIAVEGQWRLDERIGGLNTSGAGQGLRSEGRGPVIEERLKGEGDGGRVTIEHVVQVELLKPGVAVIV